MNRSQYENDLVAALAGQRDAVAQRLSQVLANLPPKATDLEIAVFPDQDGEGSFGVRASVAGPDLYVLNKAIEEHAELLVVRHTESGFEPAVPMVDPFDVEYPVNDIIVDKVAAWLAEIWQSLSNPDPGIPVTVIGHDDYGTITPLELQG